MDQQIATALSSRLEEALLSGDHSTASSVVDQALAASDFTPENFFADVLAPTDRSIRSRLSTGAISVAEQRRAAMVTLEQLVRLRAILKPRERLRRRAIIFTPDPLGSGVTARMMADLLYLDGWDTDYLGSSLSAEEIAPLASKASVDLIGVAVASESGQDGRPDAIESLAQLDPRPKVLVGAIGNHLAAVEASTKADAVVGDLRQLVSTARKIVGLSRGSAVLEEVLRSVGERLRAARKLRGMSQQEVSDKCSLDRAYLSELENGKQNATIGALIKVTSALDVSLRDLFS